MGLSSSLATVYEACHTALRNLMVLARRPLTDLGESETPRLDGR